jgi:hypothetical protein
MSEDGKLSAKQFRKTWRFPLHINTCPTQEQVMDAFAEAYASEREARARQHFDEILKAYGIFFNDPEMRSRLIIDLMQSRK